MEGIWIFLVLGESYWDNNILSLQPWSPYYDQLKEKENIQSLWVKIPSFPLELLKGRGFQDVGD